MDSSKCPPTNFATLSLNIAAEDYGHWKRRTDLVQSLWLFSFTSRSFLSSDDVCLVLREREFRQSCPTRRTDDKQSQRSRLRIVVEGSTLFQFQSKLTATRVDSDEVVHVGKSKRKMGEGQG